MRLQVTALVVFSLFVLGAADSCTAVGGGAMSQSALGDSAVRGRTMRPAVDDAAAPAVVGIDWPEGGAYGTIEILFEPGKETSFADNDAMASITNFGALTLDLTQGTAGARPQYQSPCDVGPAIPCMYYDGGDRLVDSGIRSTLRYLHNGAGASCYVVAENTSTSGSNGHIFATSQGGGNGVGIRNTSSTSDRWDLGVRSTGTMIWQRPTTGIGLQDQTWGAYFVHGTARTLDGIGEWIGATPGGTEADYSAAPTDADPQTALSIGAYANAVLPITAYMFALACYSALHSATEIAGVWAAVEAETGALPQ